MDKLCSVIHDRFGDSPESIKAVLVAKISNKPMAANSTAPEVTLPPHK
jgi:hypothetical protein